MVRVIYTYSIVTDLVEPGTLGDPFASTSFGRVGGYSENLLMFVEKGEANVFLLES